MALGLMKLIVESVQVGQFTSPTDTPSLSLWAPPVLLLYLLLLFPSFLVGCVSDVTDNENSENTNVISNQLSTVEQDEYLYPEGATLDSIIEFFLSSRYEIHNAGWVWDKSEVYGWLIIDNQDSELIPTLTATVQSELRKSDMNLDLLINVYFVLYKQNVEQDEYINKMFNILYNSSDYALSYSTGRLLQDHLDQSLDSDLKSTLIDYVDSDHEEVRYTAILALSAYEGNSEMMPTLTNILIKHGSTINDNYVINRAIDKLILDIIVNDYSMCLNPDFILLVQSTLLRLNERPINDHTSEILCIYSEYPTIRIELGTIVNENSSTEIGNAALFILESIENYECN